MRKKIINIALIMVMAILAAWLVYTRIYNKPHPDFAAMKPDFLMEAADLYQAFVDDEAAANERYGGKVVQISGMPDAVEQANGMVIVSFVFAEGFFGPSGIRASMLESQHEQAETMVPGIRVTLKGLCVGFDESVILEHAILISN